MRQRIQMGSTKAERAMKLLDKILKKRVNQSTLDAPEYIQSRDPLEQRIQQLEESLIFVNQFALFQHDAVLNRPHLGVTPFSSKSPLGDFIFLTNRSVCRYSYVYEELDGQYVYHNNSISVGRTALMICRSIQYIQGTVKIAYDFTSDYDWKSQNGRFLVFQDPSSKLRHHGTYDIIADHECVENAIENAKRFTNDHGISTLIAEKKELIDWN